MSTDGIITYDSENPDAVPYDTVSAPAPTDGVDDFNWDADTASDN
jgi:hypothetical protein